MRVLRIAVFLAMAALVVQYITGLITNIYAPASGYTSGSVFAPYVDHFVTGIVLGILAIAVLVLCIRVRDRDFVVLATVALASIVLAGVFGMAFIHTSPNEPIYSVGMGIAFLAAFFAGGTLAGLVNRRFVGGRARPPTPVVP